MRGKIASACSGKALLISLALLLILINPGYAKTNLDWTRTINLNNYLEIPMIEVKEGDTLNVEIQVTSGSAIDVLLMRSIERENYINAIKQSGTFNYIEEGSSKAVTTKKYNYTFRDGGDYYLIIDNTDIPKAGGTPNNQVEIKLKVSVVTPSPAQTSKAPIEETPAIANTETKKTSGFEIIFTVVVILALVIRKK